MNLNPKHHHSFLCFLLCMCCSVFLYNKGIVTNISGGFTPSYFKMNKHWALVYNTSFEHNINVLSPYKFDMVNSSLFTHPVKQHLRSFGVRFSVFYLFIFFHQLLRKISVFCNIFKTAGSPVTGNLNVVEKNNMLHVFDVWY